MTIKEIKKYKEMGFSKSVIDFTVKFLEDNEYKLFNLALLGAGEMRIMFTDKNGRTDAKIFNIPE